MPTISAQWTGLKEITAAFAEAKTIITEEIIPYSLTYGIQLVEQEAKNIVPVRTGFLRDSIQVAEGGEGGIGTSSFGGLSETCTATAGYAGFVERGTSKMVGRFYMMNAMMSALPSFVYTIQSRLSEAFAYSGRKF